MPHWTVIVTDGIGVWPGCDVKLMAHCLRLSGEVKEGFKSVNQYIDPNTRPWESSGTIPMYYIYDLH